MTHQTRKQAIKMLDSLASQIVRGRGKCERCGSTNNLATAHIHSRTHFNTRWDLQNLLCLCYRCHIHWAHKNPIEFNDWVKDYLGETDFNCLKVRANMSAKGQDLEAIRIYLENQ